MDPKLSNLDPKLQDAYRRVMGDPATNPLSGQSQTQQLSQQPITSNIPPPADPGTETNPYSQYVGTSPQNPNSGPNPGIINAPITPAAPVMSNQSQPPQESPPPMPEVSSQMKTDQTPPTAPPESYGSNPPLDSTPVTNPTSPAMPSSSSTIAFNAENSSKNIGTTPVKKRGLHALPLLVGLGILVLLVVYTFVWIVIFNVEIPFIPAL